MPYLPTMPREATLRLDLLGGFAARDGRGREIEITSRKAQALLAVLSLAPGQPQTRDKLTALLWSDRAEPQARASLRQALVELRRILPDRDPPLLATRRESLCVDPGAVAVDAVEMERLFDEGSPQAIEEAVDLWRGDLLDGLSVRDPAFEDWLRVERARLRDRTIQALRSLLERQSGAEALATAQRLLALDPLDEGTHRALMRLYAESGDRGMAIKQYESCREVLGAELGLRPEAATDRLLQEIRQEEVGDDTARNELVPRSTLHRAIEISFEAEKPSIAVLPFANLSGDPQQEYFADGLTTDIITELGRFRDFRVISHYTSQAYRAVDTDPVALAGKLAVAFLLRGSVRRQGPHLRVSAHLLDAESGAQLWAERYDRTVRNVFEIQDEIVQSVVGTLAGRLRDVGERRAARKAPENLGAYDCVLRGRRLRETLDPAQLEPARAFYYEAIRIDPRYAAAHAELSMSYIEEYESLWTPDPAAAGARALEHGHKAIELDDLDSHSHLALASGHLYVDRDFEAARIHLDRAVELNPNDYACLCWRGWLMIFMGDAGEAIACSTKAVTLNPFAPVDCLSAQGLVAYLQTRYDEAIAILTKVTGGQYGANPILAASYAQAGDRAAARETMRNYVETARAVIPGQRAAPEVNWQEIVSRVFPLREPRDRDHLIAGLREAGLPI